MPEGSFLLPLRVLLLPSHVLVLPEPNLLLTYFQLLPLRVPLLPERVFVWYSLHLIRASQNLAIYSNRFSGLGTEARKTVPDVWSTPGILSSATPVCGCFRMGVCFSLLGKSIGKSA